MDEQKTLLQFNCSCEDALPYCNALCCRLRPWYNAGLNASEVDKYEHTFTGNIRGGHVSLPVIAHNDKHCIYLDSDKSLCKTHHDKPEQCKEWHCSPGGVGEGITKKQHGWLIVPYFQNT